MYDAAAADDDEDDTGTAVLPETPYRPDTIGPCGKVHSTSNKHSRRLCANHIIGRNQNNYRVIGLDMDGHRGED